MEQSILSSCFFEFLGTMVLLMLGCGVVACTNLQKSKGFGGGWIVVTMAWGIAVICGVLIAGPYTGAHLSPAVSLGLAVAGKFSTSAVVPFVFAQILGAMAGAGIVYLYYKDHFDITEDAETKLAVFCTFPAIRNVWRNFFCEVVATSVLLMVILFMGDEVNTARYGLGSVGAIPVGLLIMVLGMSLGGTTGYSLNPARDLGPRIMHAILPIKGKGGSDWAYSWVPVVGPLVGALVGAGIYMLAHATL